MSTKRIVYAVLKNNYERRQCKIKQLKSEKQLISSGGTIVNR